MATYYVDGAVGNDGNLGTSEGAGNAWATVQKAVNTVALGDVVYIKNSVSYSEDISMTTIGNSANPIVFVGYTSTPGDHGMVTLTPTSTGWVHSATSNTYLVFMNISIDGASGTGWSFSGADSTLWINCEGINNGGAGWITDNSAFLLFCTAANNGDNGADLDFNGRVAFSRFFGNTPVSEAQLEINSGHAIGCLFYGSTNVPGLGGAVEIMVFNTADGEGTVTDAWVQTNGSGSSLCVANLVHDYDDGIVFNTDNSLRQVMYNAFTSLNGVNYLNADFTIYQRLFDVSGSDPGFTDEAGDDYTLSNTSLAYEAGPLPGSYS